MAPSVSEHTKQRAKRQTKACKKSTTSRRRKRCSSTVDGDRSTKRHRSQSSPRVLNATAKSGSDGEVKVEPPRLVDFEKDYGIPKRQFTWGDPEPGPKEELFDEEETAPPPAVPSAYCNYGRSARQAALLRSPSLDSSSCLRRRLHESPSVSPSPEPEARPRIIIRLKKTKKGPGLMDMPAEVREEIYRGLLVSHKPIPVYDGWRRVYQRENPELDINILMVSKKIFVEARGVLYGENTFLYRLRDMPGRSQVMANVRELASNHVYVPQGEDSLFVNEDNLLGGEPHLPGTINIQKYAPYFRYITLQADHNRYSAHTREFMANAIKTFARSAPGKNNIHTLSIVISPRYIDQGKFTFVDFFDPKSCLIDALKCVSCETIRVHIWNEYLSDGMGPPCTRLMMRVHQLRFFKHLVQQQQEEQEREKRVNERQAVEGHENHQASKPKRRDIWRKDERMHKFRFKRLCAINKRLEKLKSYVFEACNKHMEKHKRSRHNATDEQGWSDDEESAYLLADGADSEVDFDQEFDEPNDSDNDSDFDPN
ncbi:hypothetical protein F66182_2872 [Fusarium sp. NRRL 66182]|nr:hypothetical protein F66182_2872 [Fusarium sp. NRRL 66182]